MSMLQDPFYVVKDEVQQSVNGVSKLFERWKELLRTTNTAEDEEFAWTANELKSGVRSIEWDLQDLDETVAIVEANPAKFSLDADEVARRKQFVSRTRALLGEIKQALVSSSAAAKQEADARAQLTRGGRNAPRAYDKFAALESAIDRDNAAFLADQQQVQRRVMDDQDADLTQLEYSVGNLHQIGHTINTELDVQNQMLAELEEDVDSTSAKMRMAIKKTSKILKDTADKKPWLVIGCLFIILIALIVVAFEM